MAIWELARMKEMRNKWAAEHDELKEKYPAVAEQIEWEAEKVGADPRDPFSSKEFWDMYTHLLKKGIEWVKRVEKFLNGES